MSEVMRHAGDYSKEDVLRAQHNMNMIAANIDKGTAVGPSVEGMRPPEPMKLRPNVAKHLAYFQKCIASPAAGPDMVRGVLKSKDGRYGKAKITFALSKKDKYQLLQALGLLDHKGVTDAPE